MCFLIGRKNEWLLKYRVAYNWSSIRRGNWWCCSVLQRCIWQSEYISSGFRLASHVFDVFFSLFIQVAVILNIYLLSGPHPLWVCWKHEKEGHSSTRNRAQVYISQFLMISPLLWMIFMIFNWYSYYWTNFSTFTPLPKNY